jgi:hypothetical protein
MSAAAPRTVFDVRRDAAECDSRLLLRKIEAYLASTGDSPQTFGTRAAGDSKFVASLRQGRKCNFQLEQRVLSWLHMHFRPGPDIAQLFAPSPRSVEEHNEILAHRLKEEAMLLGIPLQTLLVRLTYRGAKSYAAERGLDW